MLRRDFDTVLIGKSYLSSILSLELLVKENQVLLLDDSQLSYGDLYTDFLCLIEKNYLHIWGQDKVIRPLENIDEYLTLKPYTIFVDQMRIRLGDSPGRNLKELLRKLAFCVSGTQEGSSLLEKISEDGFLTRFDQDFDSFSRVVAYKAYGMVSGEELKLAHFLQHCPEELLLLFECLKNCLADISELSEEELWALKIFICMGRTHFQERLSFSVSEIELFHIIVSLLSPSYILDEQRLCDDLLGIHKKLGGYFKKTNISEYFFAKGRPWRVELSSFEGVIEPSKIVLLGNLPNESQISLVPKQEVYTSIKVTWKFANKLEGCWDQERILFSSISKIGTDRPMWEATFSANKVVAKVFVSKEKGCKISFLQDEIREILMGDLASFMSISSNRIIDEKMEFSSDIWIKKGLFGQYQVDKKSSEESSISLQYSTFEGKNISLKDIYYLGPCNTLPLGLLSSLMDIRSTCHQLA